MGTHGWACESQQKGPGGDGVGDIIGLVHTSFVNLSLKAPLHARDMFLQSGMFCAIRLAGTVQNMRE